MANRADRLPPRTLPVVYLAFAHLSLLLALLLLATRPEAVLGFPFFTPRLLAVLHLITLGWITATTLGATYVVGPLALRMPARTTWVDTAACVLFVLGAAGVVAHLWLAALESTWWGVAASGAMLLLAFGAVAVRWWRALAEGGAPLPVRLHVGGAYLNLLLAALLGVLLAANRESAFLPATPLQRVAAHANLAGIGWATLMVAGVGYRLLAMLFPAAPPPDRPVWASFFLFQTGTLGLALTLLFAPGWAVPFALLVAAALLLFVGIVVWMRRHPRPPPAKLRRPDFGVLHVLAAFAWLLVAMGAGLTLLLSPEVELGAAWLYGVAGLLGFLAQVIVGVQMRLLPMFAFTEGFAGGGYRAAPPSPHDMPRRPLQAVSLLLWTAGVPLLALGLAGSRADAVVAGAWALFVAVIAAAVNNALVLRHAYAQRK